jgi:predicted ATPase
VIGREFGYDLLAAVSNQSEPQLHEVLDRLWKAGLLFVRGVPPASSYIFKHALVQDAAYGTLLRGRRQLLHGRIATTLQERFPEVVLAQPEMLAQHYAEAGQFDNAADYGFRAAHQAIEQSQLIEAESQLNKGLNHLENLPEGIERQQRELDLQNALIVTLMQTRGYAAPAVAETLARARELCEQLNQPPQLANVLYVQTGHHILRGELLLACQNALEHLRLGEARNDLLVQSIACANSAGALNGRGECIAARAYAERALELYKRANISSFAMISPQDPKPTALISLSEALSSLGFLDQSRLRRDEALVIARQRAHANTLALILAGACGLDARLRSWSLLLERATELESHSAEHSLPFFAAQASIYRGSSLSALGHTDQGLTLLNEGLAAYRATGALVGVPGFLLWLADCYRDRGSRMRG